ncbi:zinc finger BED domain-containing protein RICESLEEPER 2-like [Alnus glutinosa]|uniref:zinc finger BED domain-containing protein RICESLEEPER 2-like n=1 Tax=Alnus glutinosa TaxID=3517 RepID=UPI002D796D7C|nr:zinc finger BED domain-containing protein RICESLEEPER 2-like [Alnus glutinosa]
MVKYVKGSPHRLAQFKSCAERKTIACNASLTLDVPTRWNSTYTMLEVAVKYERAFDLMIDEDSNFVTYLCDDGPGKRGLGLPNDDDWANVQHFIKFLKVFYDVTMQILASFDDDKLSDMAFRMKLKYDKYWGDFEKINLLLFIAFVLDPRYKMEVLEFWFLSNIGEAKTDRIVFKLKNILEQLYSHYAMHDGESGPSGARMSNEGRISSTSTSLGVGLGSGTSYDPQLNKDALKDFHTFQARRNLMLAQTEIEKYYVEGVEIPSDTFDILMWWNVNSAKYPVLSRIARDVLAIPLTTVASESAFSTGGRVIDCYRSSLAPKTVEALICT